MRSSAVALIVAAFAMRATAGDSAQVEVKPVGDGRFELSVELAGVTDPDLAQQRLGPAATELCGALPVQLGRYRFESNAPLAGTKPSGVSHASVRFMQEVRCGTAITASRLSPPPPAPATPPTAEDEAGIRTQTLHYLTAKDEGSFESALAMFSESSAGMFTEASWRDARAAFNAASGRPERRQVVRVTWYDNPPNAPTPGRYAAADYSAGYANAAFYCGYVVWLRQADGSYRIVREEEAQMPPEVMAKVPPEQLPAMRAQVGCRD
ncbi:DUF4019 domain-containing protein [Lysobacter niastensis]|uniref:DUF4019 domain-containing protein n=1 Tax=Lysobacter niastensis TaxID=380629 RepID=A0ABS0BA63_9GAMM|nr:DUF4019 domain-containing protein [Lysobacter niastensis]MBF6024576.1 DUF4019 domain-containing protein [Lysobacter niastensis]